MFAVIKTGGKQYKVAQNQVLSVEKLDAEPGATLTFESVLMVGDGDQVTTGAPYVAGAAVTAEVVRARRGPKIIVFKKKRRKNYRRRNGHRQDLTELRIAEILTDGQKPSKAKAKPKPKAEEKAEAPESQAPEAQAPDAAAEAVVDTPVDTPVGTAPQALEAPEGKADDLKKISGVGPQIEKKLNGAGIFHFHQIAALGAAEVAWVDDHLSFKGRIERDDWIGQAKALAADAATGDDTSDENKE